MNLPQLYGDLPFMYLPPPLRGFIICGLTPSLRRFTIYGFTSHLRGFTIYGLTPPLRGFTMSGLTPLLIGFVLIIQQTFLSFCSKTTFAILTCSVYGLYVTFQSCHCSQTFPTFWVFSRVNCFLFFMFIIHMLLKAWCNFVPNMTKGNFSSVIVAPAGLSDRMSIAIFI